MYVYVPHYCHSFFDIEPSEVNSVRAVSQNDTTLLISWDPPTNPNGVIHNYTITITNLKDGSTERQKNTPSTTLLETNLGE